MRKKKSKNKKKEIKASFRDEKKLTTKTKKKNIIINQEIIFNNNSEIIARKIIDKILLNVFYEIKAKNFYFLLGDYCSNYAIKFLNSFLSLSYIRYEQENLTTKFHPPQEECNIPQPLPGEFDRWKIHRLKLIKYKKKFLNDEKRIRRKSKSIIINKLTKTQIKRNSLININSKISKSQKNEINKEKSKKEGLKFIHSFPYFPITDSDFKNENYLTKELEKQIESFREEILNKEKEEEKRKKFKYLKYNLIKEQNNNNDDSNKKELNEKNEFKGKKVGVTVNGEIIFIKNLNIKELKSEFMHGISKMKNETENEGVENINNNKKNNISIISPKTIIKKNNIFNNISEKKEIEKNKEIEDIYSDPFYENKKNKLNQEFIIAGSSFDHFIPETGVNLKQGKDIKSGGNDFTTKYKKTSYDSFEKKFEIYSRTNRANKSLIEIKKENDSEISNNIQKGNRGFGNKAPVWLLITQEQGAYKHDETCMAFVDAGIFTMNLLYALHYYKLAACTLNAQMNDKQEKVLRQLLNLPSSEIPAVFITVGIPPKRFMVARSQLLDVDMITQICNKTQ